MFYHAKSFNQDISNWNTSNVKNMYGMFQGAKSFNQDISKWDIKSDTLLNGFLFDATNFGTSIKSWQFNDRFNDRGQLFTNFGSGSKLCKADQSGALYPNSDLVPDYISNGGIIKGTTYTPATVFCF
jgi:surface protein